MEINTGFLRIQTVLQREKKGGGGACLILGARGWPFIGGGLIRAWVVI